MSDYAAPTDPRRAAHPRCTFRGMTRFRALVISGVLVMGFTFGGCFDFGGGDDCQAQAAAAGDPHPCL